MAEVTKTPAKKTAPRKVAPKATASKAAAAKTAPKVETAVKNEDARLVSVARSAAETYVGFGVLAAETVKSQAEAGIAMIEKLLEDARGKGESRIAEFRSNVDPIADRIKGQMEPLTSRLEDMEFPKLDLADIKVPAQISEFIEKNNERVRSLVSK